MEVDEAALLKAYNLDSLEQTEWNEVDTTDGEAGAGANAQLLNDEPDPLGLQGTLSMSRTVDRSFLGQVHLSSKTFDPKVFLSVIHPEATFADLTRGNDHLKHSIEQRSEALKILVENNFDKFVAVKATTDGVYREMKESKEGPLREDSEYGLKELKEILANASAKADQVFMPVLENNLKAVKLRSTLGVFERSRFFFNLPGSLSEAVAAGRYEQALRDYKKGKFLLDSRPGQLLAFNTTAGQSGDATATGSAKQQAQQKRVFAKVWDAVEATMEDMKEQLFGLLKQPKRGVEEQEKTIEILLDLEPSRDPVAVFLELQHNHILDLMATSYKNCIAKVEAAASVANLVTRGETERAKDLQDCIRQLSKTEQDYDRMIGAQSWKAIVELIRSLSETIVQTLPSFWRVCKNLVEGKLKSRAQGVQAQAKTWATQSVQMYIQYIAEFFNLTDWSVMARQASIPLSNFVPTHSSSMTAGYYMRSTLTELTEAVNDIKALKIGSTPLSLENLVINAAYCFTEVLCQLWVEDAKIIHRLEDWTLNPDEEATTLFLGELTAFHKSNTRMAYRIASGKEASSRQANGPAASRIKDSTSLPSEFTTRIKSAFLDSIYVYLDGLVHLAFSEYNPLEAHLTTSQKLVQDSSRVTKSIIDVKELDTRILLAVTNLSHLTKSVVPLLARQFQETFNSKMVDEVATIDEVALELDKILFTDFIERKGTIVSTIFKEGILSKNIDWSGIPKPAAVHPFIYEALLSLVQTHAQVRTVGKPLVPRTMATLLENSAEVILQSFEQVPRFGMGGMLQATLEIEFTHQTLSQYVSTKAEKLLKQIYQTISQKYVKQTGARGAEEDASLQNELESVKKILISSRKATALEFLCFRKAREGTSSSDKERKDSKRSHEKR
jgi:exocyst complex component 2